MYYGYEIGKNRKASCTTPRLVLSKKAMIRRYDDDYIPLVRDLNRRYGAPIVHYAARASGFVVNGLPLKLDVRNPTYVIFDTGLSGMAVSDELFEGQESPGEEESREIPMGGGGRCVLRDSRRRIDRATRREAHHDAAREGYAVDAE